MVLGLLWVLLGCSWGLLWFLDGSGRLENATLLLRIGDLLWLLDESGRLKTATLLLRISVTSGIRKGSKRHLTRDRGRLQGQRLINAQSSRGQGGVRGGLLRLEIRGP